MTLRRVDDPTLLVTVEQARANSRIDSDVEDDLIEAQIRAATAYAERWCGTAFVPQTWEQVLDAFPANAAEIDLEIGPITSVTSIKYDDPDGVEQTVDPANYRVDTVSRRGWVMLSEGAVWPETMATINAVRVQFVVGAADEDVKQAVLLVVDHWYQNRGASGEKVEELPFGVAALLNLHRRLFV